MNLNKGELYQYKKGISNLIPYCTYKYIGEHENFYELETFDSIHVFVNKDELDNLDPLNFVPTICSNNQWRVLDTHYKELYEQQIAKDNEDKVNHPSHYTWLKELCGVEVIDITRHMDFDLGNSLKYILRCGHKSEKGYTDKEKTIEDLRKAIFYINDYIEHL